MAVPEHWDGAWLWWVVAVHGHWDGAGTLGLCRNIGMVPGCGGAVHGHWDGAATLGLCRDFGAVCWYDLYSSINGEYRND